MPMRGLQFKLGEDAFRTPRYNSFISLQYLRVRQGSRVGILDARYGLAGLLLYLALGRLVVCQIHASLLACIDCPLQVGTNGSPVA